MAIILGGKASERVRLIIKPVPSWRKIVGVTKDASGAAIAACVVDLFRTVNEVFVNTTTSDASGVYSFDVAGSDGPFYVVAYKAGAPDVSGVTVNTLVGT